MERRGEGSMGGRSMNEDKGTGRRGRNSVQSSLASRDEKGVIVGKEGCIQGQE